MTASGDGGIVLREPAGIYVHVPYCSAICPYCDFAVTTGSAEVRRRFARTLAGEVRLHADFSEVADTIYFGGGTPTALSDDSLGLIFATLRGTLAFAGEPRITIEANPEDVSRERLSAWRAFGVHTLSLGVQSFDDRELRLLARRHTGAEARRAVEIAREAGFGVVSVDLIFGLPGQSRAGLVQNLTILANLAPEHVSLYQLTIHDETPFGRQRAAGRLTELGEGEQADLYLTVHDFLASAGWEAYEVSNFARSPLERSRHNQKYWTHVPYLGIGPSAASFRDAERWWNDRDLTTWSDRVARGEKPIRGAERLGRIELALEEVFLRIRTVEGIDLARFERRHGFDLRAANASLLDSCARDGLLRQESERIALTPRGFAVADGIARALELE